MSLILDALKKSEAERRRGELPTFNTSSAMHLPPSSKKSNSSTIILVSFLVLIGSALAFYFWSRPSGNLEVLSNNSPTADSVLAASNNAGNNNTQTEKNIAAASTALPEKAKPAPSIAAEKPIVIQAKPEIKPAEPAPVAEAAADIDTTPAVSAPRANADSVANVATLSAELRQQLPAMKLSMHVYANEPSKRFAIMDGARINEGSVVGQGFVQRISPEGVIISINGQDFLVPRP
jgi:general secretion pathway protein B